LAHIAESLKGLAGLIGMERARPRRTIQQVMLDDIAEIGDPSRMNNQVRSPCGIETGIATSKECLFGRRYAARINRGLTRPHGTAAGNEPRPR
jgi:hypothetical protein